ncbi:hypothetical protein PG987_010601 [Apiospora arundinis]
MSPNSTKAKLLEAISHNKYVSKWLGVTDCRVNPVASESVGSLEVTSAAKDKINDFMRDYSAVMDLTAPKKSGISSFTSQIVQGNSGTKMATFDCNYFVRRREAERLECTKFERISNRVNKYVGKSTQYEVLEVVYSFICQIVELLPEEDTGLMAPDDVDELSLSRREDGWGRFSKDSKVAAFLRQLGRINGRGDTWGITINALQSVLHIAGGECAMLVLDRRDLIDVGLQGKSDHKDRVDTLTSVLGQTFPPAHQFLMTREHEMPYRSWIQSRLGDECNRWSPAEHFALCPSQESLEEKGVPVIDFTERKIY